MVQSISSTPPSLQDICLLQFQQLQRPRQESPNASCDNELINQKFADSLG
jgi:hypothetical protein